MGIGYILALFNRQYVTIGTDIIEVTGSNRIKG